MLDKCFARGNLVERHRWGRRSSYPKLPTPTSRPLITRHLYGYGRTGRRKAPRRVMTRMGGGGKSVSTGYEIGRQTMPVRLRRVRRGGNCIRVGPWASGISYTNTTILLVLLSCSDTACCIIWLLFHFPAVCCDIGPQVLPPDCKMIFRISMPVLPNGNCFFAPSLSLDLFDPVNPGIRLCEARFSLSSKYRFTILPLKLLAYYFTHSSL